MQCEMTTASSRDTLVFLCHHSTNLIL
jgi:hypothetical protein